MREMIISEDGTVKTNFTLIPVKHIGAERLYGYYYEDGQVAWFVKDPDKLPNLKGWLETFGVLPDYAEISHRGYKMMHADPDRWHGIDWSLDLCYGNFEHLGGSLERYE